VSAEGGALVPLQLWNHEMMDSLKVHLADAWDKNWGTNDTHEDLPRELRSPLIICPASC